MEVDTDPDVVQILGVSIGRISTNNDSLAHNGGTFADDSSAQFAIIGTANLTPFTTSLELRLTELEK
jgi:hypothetical protein